MGSSIPRRDCITPPSPPQNAVVATNSYPIQELIAPVKMLRPLSHSASASCAASLPTSNNALSELTPPTTPEKPANFPGSATGWIEPLISSAESESKVGILSDDLCAPKELKSRRDPLEKLPEEPQLYSKKYRIDRRLGGGAWSNVYSAVEQSQTVITSALLPPSPPTSPESKIQARRAKVLAVKMPSERMAHKILRNEACILTYLHSHARAISYLVPFHGFEYSTHSIVMDAVPTSLEAFVKSTSKDEFSTKSMFDPIIGAKNWASLAKQLIDGLAFLHDVQCIHGDIKPANILIRPVDGAETFTPLYCDFSSARIQTSDRSTGEIEEIAAVTKDYLSPELLELLVGRNGDRAIATFASDVFALAVTLIHAAIGASPYATAQMEMQKLSMAKEGTPIDFARQGPNGSRIMRGKAVAKILGPAVEKDPQKRITVSALRELLVDVLQRWAEGGWINGV